MLQTLQEGDSLISKLEKAETKQKHTGNLYLKGKRNSTLLEVSGYQIPKEGTITCLWRKHKATEDVLHGATQFEGCSLENTYSLLRTTLQQLEKTGRKFSTGRSDTACLT